MSTPRILDTTSGEAGGHHHGPGACSIRSLDLGPLDLNLLGPRVAPDPVVLLGEAGPGAASCSEPPLRVADLLDGGLGGHRGGLLRQPVDRHRQPPPRPACRVRTQHVVRGVLNSGGRAADSAS